jgi:hypothetical protein
MKSIVPINELEKRMRPGACSEGGFLGLTESLEAVLLADELALQELGISYDGIAAELENILDHALKKKYELQEQNFEEFQEREWHSIDLYTALSSLPGRNTGYLVDNTYQVLFVQYRGHQECPWNCQTVGWGSFDFLLVNLQTGEYVAGPGLIVHLIREHHFFEGLESPYRVEPHKLAQLLGFNS